MDKTKVTFYNAGTVSELQPLAGCEYVKELPAVYFIEEEGCYRYDDKIWPIAQEGLYRFQAREGAGEQHCYYKKDTAALLEALMLCCDFAGERLFIEHFDLLNARLAYENEKNLPPLPFFQLILTEKRLAIRQVAIYSPVLGNCLLDWLEVWEEKEQSWVLYWLDKAVCLGKTNKDRTCFAVFEDFCRGASEMKFLAGAKKIVREIEAEDFAAILNDAMESSILRENFFRENLSFPVMRADGLNILKAVSSSKYADCAGDERSILLTGKDSLTYKLRFEDDDYIKDVIYGAQIYLVKDTIVRMV